MNSRHQAEELIGAGLAGAALPHPHCPLDRVEDVPGQIPCSILTSPLLQEPVDYGDGNQNPEDLGAQIPQDLPGGGIEAHQKPSTNESDGDD